MLLNNIMSDWVRKRCLDFMTLSWGGKIVRIIIFILTLALIVVTFNKLLLSISDLNYQYPREYRDGAMVDIANQFTNNINPYTIENSLPHTYVYGFIFPYIDSVVKKIVSFDLIEIHHFITLLCIILICLLVGLEIFRKTRSISLILMSLAIVLSFNIVNLRPEPLAIALTALALYLVNNSKMIGFRKILSLSLISLALFYIKPYFVMIFGVLMVYFIFNQSKKSLFQLFITFASLSLVSAIIISIIFPLYFPHSVMNNMNMFNTHKISWMVKQTIDFVYQNWLMVTVFFTVVITSFMYKPKLAINFKDVSKPLLITNYNAFKSIYFTYATISIVVLTLMIGQHTGTYMTYYNQLLIIPIVVFSFTYGYDIISKFKYRDAIFVAFILLFLFQYRGSLNFIKIDHNNENNSWAQAINYIKDHDPANAYLSAHFASEAVLEEWPIYDNGQTDTFGASAIFGTKHNYLKPLFPNSKYIPEQLEQWNTEIDKKINNKQFSIIALSSEYKGLINGDVLRENYIIDKEVDLPINLGHIEFWQPKKWK